jgi:hypothetical protein
MGYLRGGDTGLSFREYTKQRMSAWSRAAYLRDPEKYKARSTRWRIEHPEADRAIRVAYKARQAEAQRKRRAQQKIQEKK